MLPLPTALWLVLPPVVILAVAILYYVRKEGTH
jgi:hypothetical protein